MLLKIKEVAVLVGLLPLVIKKLTVGFELNPLYIYLYTYINEFFFLQLKSLNLTSKSTLNNQLKNFLLNISLLVHQMNFNVVETVNFFKKKYNFRKFVKVFFFT